MARGSRWTRWLAGPHGEEHAKRSGKDRRFNPRRAEVALLKADADRAEKERREAERRERRQRRGMSPVSN